MKKLQSLQAFKEKMVDNSILGQINGGLLDAGYDSSKSVAKSTTYTDPDHIFCSDTNTMIYGDYRNQGGWHLIGQCTTNNLC